MVVLPIFIIQRRFAFGVVWLVACLLFVFVGVVVDCICLFDVVVAFVCLLFVVVVVVVLVVVVVVLFVCCCFLSFLPLFLLRI